MENFAAVFIVIVLLIPLYAVLIWTYSEPEKSILFGKRWMFKEEPEPSQKAVRYTKFFSMTVMIGLPIIITSFLVDVHILRLTPVVLFLVLIIGAMFIFAKEDFS